MSKRMRKRNIENKTSFQINKLLEKINVQEEMLQVLIERSNYQQEILEVYYKTYQEMRKQNQKKYLMGYIRMRDDLLKDVERMKESGHVDEKIVKVLSMYIDDLDVLLEDNGVEILYCCEADEYDPEIQKPLERVETKQKELNNKVVRVFGCGYRWNGIMLKKICVSVGVYNQ